ncbi:MAG: hypothetical protein EXX96DRAFT_556294 [Benjaminiella poitrasii]|nr:MAG: hypothetical protein EXX96DRAFT_556294 [Benjaminiella poitrasii]
MSLKRSAIDNDEYKNKRTKLDSFSIISSRLEDECSACQKQSMNISLDQCINYEVQPKIYFSLALILGDPTNDYLLLNNDDYIYQLSKHAVQLAKDRLLAYKIIELLDSLYKKDNGVIVQLFQNCTIENLHKEREMKFISSCIHNSSESTVTLVKSQANKILELDLESITLSDARYARLLPLLTILNNSNSDNASGSLIILDEDEDSLDFASNNNCNDNDNEVEIINSSYNDDNDVIAAISQDASFSIVQEANGSLHNDQPQENAINVPDYAELSTIELKAKLKTYGYKTSNNRNQMIQDLQRIFISLLKNKKDKANNIPSTQQSYVTPVSNIHDSDDPELSIEAHDDVKNNIIKHLKSNEEIMKDIWLYNSVSIDKCNIGLNYKKNEIKKVLDEVAATSKLIKKKRHLSKDIL